MNSRRPMRRLALVLIFAGLCGHLPQTVEAARLHVIIAADWAMPGIGPDMEISRDSVLTSVVINTPQAGCDIWEINPNVARAQREMQTIRTKIHPFGRELSRATIMALIQRLTVSPDDFVLFFYCGHGAYSPTYGTYTLPSGDRGQAGPTLSQIRQAITQKGPRQATIVLDCCNRLRPLRGEPRPMAPFAVHREDFSPLFKGLFFSKPGVLAVTSSSPNEYSLIIPSIQFNGGGGTQYFGSLFAKHFSGELRENSENSLTWDILLPRVQQDVDQEFAEICKQGMIPLGNGKYHPQARQTLDYRW